ncbi:kinase-like domain-containing protein [Russula dissimulans]|nr:kinase-like domain-containing protein [Russula dissimulans]
MDEIKFWCCLEGDPNYFYVSVSPSQMVYDLKKRIFEERRNFFNGLDASDLILTKIDADPRDRATKDPIKAGRYRPPSDHQPLDPMDTLSDVWPVRPPSNHLHIFVELPAGGGSPTLVQTAASQNVMVPTLANRTEFIMKLRDFERWCRLCEDDLNHSNVRQARSSQFLQEFQERLGRKRYIANATKDRFRDFVQCSTIPLTFLDSYFESVVSPPAETNISELDRVTMTELTHYSSVLCGSQLRNKVNYDKNKETHVHALLLEFLVVQQPNVTCDFGTGLPFHLVIETNDGDQKMRYTPRSDFHVSIRDFPHIILEVNSQANGGDEFRMLLQAACISRIGNWLRASTSDKPIVIMAIYIDKQFQAHQHILYQPDVGSIKVEYVSKVFDLTVPRPAFEFIFQLYNFFSVAETDNACLHRPETRLAEAKESVARKDYPTLTSKRKREGSRRKAAKKSKRNPDTSAQGGGKTPISEELTLLTPLKPTIRQATSRSGVLVVLKTIIDSNERRLLHYFSGIKAPSNHTIPLLDVIDLSIEKTIIVLPWKSPLDEVLQFRDRPDDVVSLCLQFIEGVAFLHQHNVAHCDLKPGNVVVDTKAESEVSPRLFIIDLDLALSVESEETMTEGWCGTPPWIAPEIGSESGPIRRYSPILADRWACGRMIEYFAKYFPIYEAAQKTRLRAFAQRLLDVDPRARPELNQPQVIHSPRKRKAAKSQHESVPKRHTINRYSKHELENDLLPLGVRIP